MVTKWSVTLFLDCFRFSFFGVLEGEERQKEREKEEQCRKKGKETEGERTKTQRRKQLENVACERG